VPSFVNYKKGCTRLTATSDKAYQLLAHDQWFSPGTPASSTTKTGHHDIAVILPKVALSTRNQLNHVHLSVPLILDVVNLSVPLSLDVVCLSVQLMLGVVDQSVPLVLGVVYLSVLLILGCLPKCLFRCCSSKCSINFRCF